MTPPDRPARRSAAHVPPMSLVDGPHLREQQPAPDLDAFELQVIKRSRIVATGYADAIEASNQAYVAALAAIPKAVLP